MAFASRAIFAICTLLIFLLVCVSPDQSCSTVSDSSAISCSSYKFSNHVFDSCKDLLVLGAYLHWTYCPEQNTVQVAFRVAQASGTEWIAWGINLSGQKMVGTQALVAYQDTLFGTVTSYTSPVNDYSTSMEQGELSFQACDLSAEYVNGEMIVYGTLGPLPNGKSSFDHVWQAGPVSGHTLQMHPKSSANMQSKGSIDFLQKS